MSEASNKLAWFGGGDVRSRIWTMAFVMIPLGLGVGLCAHITKPFIGYQEWGSTIWAQTAYNNLRAGLTTTLGVPTGMYCGPLPIPANGYFTDHPAGLPLAVTAMFAVFGEHEWAARAIPIACSLASALMLWWLVRSCAGVRVATLSVAVFATQPMELYFGRVVDHEACGLMWIAASLCCLRCWHLTRQTRWRVLTLASLFLGMWTSWPVYIFAGIAALWLLSTRRKAEVHFGLAIAALGIASAGLYLVHIRLVRPDAWDSLLAIFRFRVATGSAGAANVPWGSWFATQLEFLFLRFSPTAWGLFLIGAVHLARYRSASENLQWLAGGTLCAFITAALWVVIFRNGSYLHSFWSFYFLLPVSIMGGYGFDLLLSLQEKGIGSRQVQRLAAIAASFAILLLVTWGYWGTSELHRRQYQITDGETSEPLHLIPILVKTIEKVFPIDTFIITNIGQSMPLEFYAHRNFIYFGEYSDWQEVLRYQGNRCRGVIWMESPGADKLLAALPQGHREIIQIGDRHFCLWSP